MSITSEIQALGKVLVLDMETALAPLSFKGRKHVRLLQLLGEDGKEWWADLTTYTDADWDELKAVLEDPQLTFIGHSLNFDYRCLFGCGIQLKGRFEDSMIQSALLNNGLADVRNTLKDVVFRVLGEVVDKSLQDQDWMNAQLNEADMAYAMGDVRLTHKVWEEQRAMIKTADLQRVYNLECALIPVVAEMEHAGMLVDQEQARYAITLLEEEIEDSRGEFLQLLDSQLRDTQGEGLPREEDGSFNLRAKKQLVRDGGRPAGFNINSSQQVIRYLNAIGINPVDPKTGKPTTDKKVLRPLADNPVVFSLLTYKRAEKRRSMIQSWLDKNIEDDGRIHARFAPLQTGTGRFSCSSPNLQQVPRETYIRDCFVAAEGCELAVRDVMNMEMAVGCSEPIANEVLMQKALRDGIDLHTFTAHLIFDIPVEQVEKPQRQIAKSCNFSLLFSSSSAGLRDYFASFGQSITLEEATEFRSAWLKAYPAMAKWHAWAKRAVDKGEVRMVDGRRRWLVGDQARPTVLLNNIVQGTAASIVKLTMVNTKPLLPEKARFIAQVHDELIVECPEGYGEEVNEIIERQLFLAGRAILGDSVDMKGDGSVAKSWGQAK